jgi:hypothetical protein
VVEVVLLHRGTHRKSEFSGDSSTGSWLAASFQQSAEGNKNTGLAAGFFVEPYNVKHFVVGGQPIFGHVN